jgi:uncharacterized membrane protein
MQRVRILSALLLLTALMFALPAPSLAQSGGGFSISADYPSMVVGIGETITLDMDLQSPVSQIVALEVEGTPDGWTTEFRGGGRAVQSVYVEAGATASVQLRIDQPDTVRAGTYRFTVVARGAAMTAEFPIELIVREKAPAKLSLQSEFPTLRGGTESPFNFSATLKNDGDEDIFVTFTADAPREFAVTIKASGKDITSLPTEIKSGASQRIDITVEPLTSLPVGSYPISIFAQGETAEASLALTAEIVGQPQLSLTTPDGALSGEAYLGKSTPIKLILRNSGNSPAVGVTLSATSPAGWTVTLDPEQVVEVPAEGEVEVTANIEPSDQAIAGDYMITFRAQPNDGASKSVDFRVTARASTLWGVVGILIIAVALGVVGLAVVRFGRR